MLQALGPRTYFPRNSRTSIFSPSPHPIARKFRRMTRCLVPSGRVTSTRCDCGSRMPPDVPITFVISPITRGPKCRCSETERENSTNGQSKAAAAGNASTKNTEGRFQIGVWSSTGLIIARSETPNRECPRPSRVGFPPASRGSCW